MGNEISDKIDNLVVKEITPKKDKKLYINPFNHALGNLCYLMSDEAVKNGDVTREGNSIFINSKISEYK